jgi:hypothetical protein
MKTIYSIVDRKVSFIVFFLIISLGIIFIFNNVLAWTSPTQNPPLGNPAMRADADGHIGIGTAPDASYGLTVSGQINASTGVCINSVCKTDWTGGGGGGSGVGILMDVTTNSYDGNQTSYLIANDLCNAKVTGSHICSSAEIMNSIASNTGTITTYTGEAWIQDGPPGYTASANDCQGWSQKGGTHLGRYWSFNPATGGKGFLTTCNVTLPFACCK